MDLSAKFAQLRDLLRRKLPIIVGRMAKDHFQENFRQSAFVNGGAHPWPPVKRQGSGASPQYGPLLSGRNHLFSSIQYTPGPYQVRISNPLPYAAIHNQGGTTHPTVTPKLRKYAWARHYSAPKDSQEAKMWKSLALTKKTKLEVRIPRRQFIGPSRELNDAISKRIDAEVAKVLNS